MKTEYTPEEAYDLSLRWMPRINKNLATNIKQHETDRRRKKGTG